MCCDRDWNKIIIISLILIILILSIFSVIIIINNKENNQPNILVAKAKKGDNLEERYYNY